MRAFRVSALGVVVLLGCSKPDAGAAMVPGPPSEGAPSMSEGASSMGGATLGEEGLPPDGHRLQPWQLEADGTSGLVLGITDAVRLVHCAFVHDSQGTLRCMPTPLELYPALAGDQPAHPLCPSTVYWADLAAYREVTNHLASIALPRSDCEPQRYRAAVIKSAKDFADGAPDCFTTEYTAELVEVVLGPHVSDDAWQAGAEVDGPALAGGRLHIKQFESEDGARFFSRITDDNFGGATCSPEGYAVSPCRPPHTTRSYYADAGCSSPIGRAPTCEKPAYFDGGDPLTIGAEYQGPVWQKPHGGCFAWSSPPDAPPAQFFLPGEPLPISAFATLDWMFSGSARLQQNGLPGDTGETLFVDDAFAKRTRFFDSQAGKGCNPVRAPDGQAYCIPIDMPSISAPLPGSIRPFEDAACTQCAFTSSSNSEVAQMLEGVSGIDQHVTALYDLRPLATAYQKDAFDRCVAIPPDGFTGYYTLGSERAWTDWPALREANAVP